MIDYIPRRPDAAPPPDTSVCQAVFARLAARLAARRRDDLPITEAALRAEVALCFAAECGVDAVWPEARSGADSQGQRLGLLVRRAGPEPLIGVECRYPHRPAPGQASPVARQLGDLLRDSERLARGFGADGLPVQVLLATDEFRAYLGALTPPLRLLRPEAAGTEVTCRLTLDALEDATRHRLAAAAASDTRTTLRLACDVLAYTPVGPLHLAMWRVVMAELR